MALGKPRTCLELCCSSCKMGPVILLRCPHRTLKRLCRDSVSP